MLYVEAVLSCRCPFYQESSTEGFVRFYRNSVLKFCIKFLDKR
jgi:hypothetical protein